MTDPITEIDGASAKMVFFARRAKGFDRQAALAWLREMADREPANVDDDDRLPEGYTPGR